MKRRINKSKMLPKLAAKKRLQRQDAMRLKQVRSVPEPIANVIAVVLELDAIHKRFVLYSELVSDEPSGANSLAGMLENVVAELRTNVLGRYVGSNCQHSLPSEAVRDTRILAGLPVEPLAEDDDESD